MSNKLTSWSALLFNDQFRFSSRSDFALRIDCNIWENVYSKSIEKCCETNIIRMIFYTSPNLLATFYLHSVPGQLLTVKDLYIRKLTIFSLSVFLIFFFLLILYRVFFIGWWRKQCACDFKQYLFFYMTLCPLVNTASSYFATVNSDDAWSTSRKIGRMFSALMRGTLCWNLQKRESV